MLSKSKRLSKVQFDEVFKKGRVFHSPLFVIRILIDTTDSRVSAVSPNKVSNTAVKRNADRRKVYHALHKLHGGIQKKCWVCIIAKKNLKETSVEDLQIDLKAVFVKSGVLE